MIGPHEGKELKLMLDGKKHLAVFHDAIPKNGLIAENIIPENLFRPYVERRVFVRDQFDVYSAKHSGNIRYVFFSSPSESWRIKAYIMILKFRWSDEKRNHDYDDIFLGRLLDYSDTDIQHFLEHQRSR